MARGTTEVGSARTLSDMHGRRNSLNVFRLVLAGMVLVSHSWPLGGFGMDPQIGGTHLGTLAVFGFFGLSGYLITGSRLKTTPRVFLWHRVLRIFPAFWVMLLVLAFVLAPLAGVAGGSRYELRDAVGYVFHNVMLYMRQSAIHDTLASAPYDDTWNGAAWTLAFEFGCYLVALTLGSLRLLRRPAVVFGLFVAGAVLLVILGPADSAALGPGNKVPTFLTFLLAFLAGSVLYLVRTRVPLRADLAGGALMVSVGSLLALSAPAAILAFPLCYLLLWLGDTLPPIEALTRNDISYGTYLWGWPVQQLAVVLHLNRWGVLPYVLICAPVAALLGWASWMLVERHALRMKDWTPRLGRR